MKIEFGFSKKRMLLLGTIGIIVVLTVSAFLFLNNGQVTQAAVVQPHPGLVGWWRFNDGSGTIASDSSGNGNNGTLEGSPVPSWTTGINGGALSFNGINDYVDIPNSPSLQIGGNAITLAFWADISNVVNFNPILTKDNIGNNRDWDVYVQGSVVNFLATIGGNLIDINTSPYTISSNTWYYIVCVYNGNQMLIYVNGSLITSYSVTGNLLGHTDDVRIGTDWGTTGRFAAATVENVQIYNRALSASEIQTGFQQPPDFSPYLLANVPQGTTQVITTLSWQGTGNINVTITTPSQTYTESNPAVTEYLKTTYSTTGGGPMSMLNIKRLSISVTALPSAQSWNITLTYDNTVSAYQINVETQN